MCELPGIRDCGKVSVHAGISICLFLTAIASEEKQLYGVQFHPEVDLSENGKEMMQNFLFRIAGLSGTYTITSRQDSCIAEIKEKVGSSKVLVSSL